MIRGIKNFIKSDDAQVFVETVFVVPLMLFMILGILQLAMLHQARLQTEYAAYQAARAGIVWNANQSKMMNAAFVALIPSMYIIKANITETNTSFNILQSIIQGAAFWLINYAGNQLNKGVLQLDQFLNKLFGISTGIPDLSLVNVYIVNPKKSHLDSMPEPYKTWGEVDFDDIGVYKADGSTYTEDEAKKLRDFNRLCITVRFLYQMVIPFANWTIHTAWMAGVTGVQLTGAIERPVVKGSNNPDVEGTIGGRINVGGWVTYLFGSKDQNLLRVLWQLRKVKRPNSDVYRGIYMIPLWATYTMRMQSNIFKENLN
ncbi:MAG: pilus assembly protein [Deltaproteobacteria bacterium]|nr:pilus assembly protein [Deltaproteobacteria bacterium]